MSKTTALGVGLTLVVACSAANDPQTSETSEALGKPDCSLVLCALPVCEPGQVLDTKPGKGGDGLTEEECAAVEAKHRGDGSGSDIYNLGLTCIYGASDCRTKGCASGQHCDLCKTIDGAAYVCLPDGSVS
jgi:hypothetical protein